MKCVRARISHPGTPRMASGWHPVNTEIWGYLYVGSFMVFALIQGFAQPHDDRNSSSSDDSVLKDSVKRLLESRWWSATVRVIYVAGLFHVALVFWAMYTSTPFLADFRKPVNTFTCWDLILEPIFGGVLLAYYLVVIPFLLCAALPALILGRWEDLWTWWRQGSFVAAVGTYITHLFVILLVYSWGLSLAAYSAVRAVPSHIWRRARRKLKYAVNFVCAPGRRTPSSVHSSTTPASLQNLNPSLEGWSSLWFILYTFGVCLLWYARNFDSTGTVKPKWTDNLG